MLVKWAGTHTHEDRCMKFWTRCLYAVIAGVFPVAAPLAAWAQPSAVEHTPAAQTFGEAAGITQREPDVPREDEAVDLFFRVSFQFTYNRVAIYFTTNGTEPAGTVGNASGSTTAYTNVSGQVTFVRN